MLFCFDQPYFFESWYISKRGYIIVINAYESKDNAVSYFLPLLIHSTCRSATSVNTYTRLWNKTYSKLFILRGNTTKIPWEVRRSCYLMTTNQA